MDNVKQDSIENNSPHRVVGGTGITNFSTVERVAICQEAIQEYGDKRLFIVDRAMLQDDGSEPNYTMAGALHCTSKGDLSEFWRIHDKIKGLRHG